MNDLGRLSPDEMEIAASMTDQVIWSGVCRLTVRGVDLYVAAKVYGTPRTEEVGFAACRLVLFEGVHEREITDFLSLEQLDAIAEGRGDTDQAAETELPSRVRRGRRQQARRADATV